MFTVERTQTAYRVCNGSGLIGCFHIREAISGVSTSGGDGVVKFVERGFLQRYDIYACCC